ncbi:fasciclin domain-containing protein [Mucilaginibacter sp. PAMB04168]|uniref:fasciclin domain-containing protein n=1 Tax=Mucilaginibacter sp. PAMB04168 TaxID=3138567 RepID=UPI0031F6F996
MKNVLAIICLLAGTLVVKAQNTPARGSSYQDSVRSQTRSGKINIVNGTPMNSAMDFVENLTQSKNHTLFLTAVRAASMMGTLKSRGPLTVFAPTDSAFRLRLGKKLDTLVKPNHKYELINLLSYHIISGRYDAKELAKQIKDGKGEATLLTLSGSKITAKIDSNRNIVLYDETGGQSVVSRFNIEQSNGTMHLVTQVLIPKDKAL